MRERPILLNGDMVRAVLNGSKTQTRRIMKVQPDSAEFESRFIVDSTKRSEIGKWCWAEPGVFVNPRRSALFSCPFGAVGDRLWVRETWQGPLFDYERMDEFLRESHPFYKPEFCEYAADGGLKPEYCDRDDNIRYGWRPSIHMPRWASRITLEITGVRVERLHAITLGDICKEIGCGLYDFRPATYGFTAWEELWQSIYGADSWQANPWVWVIEFKRVEGE